MGREAESNRRTVKSTGNGGREGRWVSGRVYYRVGMRLGNWS